MKELVNKLNKAANAYYNTGSELMSNYEYDELYNTLLKMEKETGIVLENSPTQRVGAEVVSVLPKVKHEFVALSLDKTKDITEFPNIFNCRDQIAVVMYKMDGCTGQATYENGKLKVLATRGNGEIGSNITHNAPYIKGLPIAIPFEGKLVVRGELCMTYAEFERINASLPEDEEHYKNPRNLANASVSMLDSRDMRKREIWFHAFKLVYCDLPLNTLEEQFKSLKEWEFNVVERKFVNITELVDAMNGLSNKVKDFSFPVDGLVVAANDVVYAEKQARTGHHPNKLVGYAFKWQDTSVQTTLQKIEWSASRTGLLNPVAVFDPVEIEGTTVSRASLHNVSYILDLNLKPGDKILVYKANMIIPQVEKNLSEKLHEHVLPGYIDGIRNCPVCGSKTEVMRSVKNGSVTLTRHCLNSHCPAKAVGKFVHFCERDCMNIFGMSEATIEKFVERGFIKEFSDIFKLDRYKNEIVAMEGFGEKSYKNLLKAIEDAKYTDFVSFIHALGIPNIGKGQAKLFNKEYKGDVSKFFDDVYTGQSFKHIDGIGEVLENNLLNWGKEYLKYLNPFANENVNKEIKHLMDILYFKEEESNSVYSTLEGLTFVITGSVNYFKNRDELKDFIKKNGGKTSGSVSSKTSYLINNDVTSTSGKNKKAKEIGVAIISEEQFLKMFK